MTASSAASQLLGGSPYSVIDPLPDASPDPIRFLAGGGASMADLRSGWAVTRRVRLGSTSLSFSAFCQRLLKENPSTVYRLVAPPGEGKTTFLRQMALQLADEALLLRWRGLDQHRPDLLRDIGNLGVRLVLTAEVPPTLPASNFAEVVRLVSDDPLPCPLILAGCPTPVGEVLVKGARPVSFDRLGIDEATEITDILKRLVTHSSGDALEELQRVMPNILRFVAEPQPRVFLEESPLMVGMLRATYGEDFRSRLVGEYHAVGRTGHDLQRIYRVACFMHAVGLPLPLRWLEEGGLMDERLWAHPGADPMRLVASGTKEVLVTRHPTVAGVVLKEAGLLRPSRVEAILKELFELADPGAREDRDLIRGLVGSYSSFSPIDVTATHVRGNVRRGVRAGLMQGQQWLHDARQAASSTDGELAAWADCLHRLWPGHVATGMGDAERFVVSESSHWLDRASLGADEMVLPKLDYWRWKAGWAIAQSEDREGAYVEDSLEDLESWMGSPTLNVDFYIDVATAVRRSVLPRRPADEALRFLVSDAYEYALALGGVFVEQAYGPFLSESAGILLQADRGAVLRMLSRAWELSKTLGRPNLATGTWLGQELHSVGESDWGDRVLREVLSGAFYGEALYALAARGHHSRDAALIEFVLAYYQDHANELSMGTALDQAYAHHACGRSYEALRKPEQELESLRAANDAYRTAVASDARSWQIHGEERWRAVLDRVRVLAPGALQGDVALWERLKRQGGARSIQGRALG